MRTKIKYRLMLAFSLLCLLGFVGQTLQLWRINNQLSEINPERDEVPASIEQRLLTELDKKNQSATRNSSIAMPSPFSRASQIQDYMDSVFSTFGVPALPSSSVFSSSGMRFNNSLSEIALQETDKDYHILIPVDPKQELELSTSIEDNAVSVSGVITQSIEKSQNGFASSFLSQRQFAQTLDLPTPVDEFGLITEQTNEGIRITIPKKSS